MTSHDENDGALRREREGRATAFLAAVAERDALPGDRRAEARFGSALRALEFWGDPMPGATHASEVSGSTASKGVCSLSRAPRAVDTVEATAARIFASDTIPGEGREDAEVDTIARRIAVA